MSHTHISVSAGTSETAPSISEWKRFRKVFFQRTLVIFGFVILAILGITAILAPWLAPYDPYSGNLSDSLVHPNSQYFLGTDIQGRDLLSRLIYGARTALMVGFITAGIASMIGMMMGVLAAYFGGIINIIIMRIVDAIMCFPMLLLALLLASVFGSGLQNVIIALSIALIAPYARVMYGLTLSIKENDYIKAEYAMGASHARIMLNHILPNSLPPIIVLITMQLGGLILAEATLSFIGIGITPPEASWGAMVAEGQQYLITNPWLSFAPGLAIMLVVFAFNMVGDGLRDALDPKLRGLL